ncbi:T9SS type B sorting domain-containing protein [Hyunsoonleella flava]|nr:T9SS type B sorting domain-containing protein [Hyunsoonleella flava]
METRNWYFGQNAGVSFRDARLTVLNNGAMDTPAGCSSISDRNGNLLFYTNGHTVWNRNHEIMENGEGLAGEIENIQSTIIVPVPGDDNRYYIFCTKTNGTITPLLNSGFYYGQVQFSNQNPLGEVTTRLSRISNANSGRVSAIHDIQSDTMKVLTFGKLNDDPGSKNDTFYIFTIDNTGLNRFPETITIPESDVQILSDQGAMKISPDGKKIALADTGGDNIHVFNFNANTSEINYDLGIKAGLLFDPLYSYGVEFSQDSQILYFTGVNFGNIGFLYKYLIYDNNPINEKIPLDVSSSHNYGDLQLASNGKIYVATYQKIPWDISNFGQNLPPNPISSIGVINDPEDKNGDGNSEYQALAIDLSSNASLQGLPNFVVSFLRNRIITEDKCVDEFFDFTTDSYIPVDSIFWDFGDGNTSTEISPTHQYITSGNFLVNATITYRNTPYRIQKIVEVFPKPILNPNEVLSQCDTDFDGVSLFNLENIGDRVLNKNRDFEYSFYRTSNDALTETNIISNAENYENTLPLEELFVKIVTPKGCSIIRNFFIETSNSNLFSAESIYTCEDSDNLTNNEIGRFDLLIKATDIKAEFGLPNTSKITFHTSFEDAQTKLNTLSNFHNTSSTTLWFRIETENNNCAGIGSFPAIVNTNISAEIEDLYTICYSTYDGAIFLDGNAVNDVWEWRDGSGAIISNDRNVRLSEAGNYSLTIYKTENGLTCSLTKNFEIRLPNVMSFREVTTENNQISISIQGFSDYEFSIDGETYFGSGDEYTFSNVEAGVYTVTVRDINDCEIPIETVVGFIGYPKFFTPNGDGINDYWKIKGVSPELYNFGEIHIYDRYGKSLFFMDLKTNLEGWDGTFNGQLLVANDYWFRAVLTDNENNTIVKTGHFTLKR